MFDQKNVFLGIAPIGWCNDDMPELGGENTFQQTVSEMALAGFTGCEIGNKYPKDPAELKRALDLRGMRIASRWYSSFILTRPFEEEEKDFIANLDFLAAVPVGMLPSIKGIDQNETYLSNPIVQQFSDEAAVITKAVEEGTAIGFEHGPSAPAGLLTSQGVIEEMFQDIITNGTDVQTAAKAAEDKLNEIFATMVA